MAQGLPGRLRPRIFSTFGTTRVVGLQPNAPAAFTPGEIPGTHFKRLSRPKGFVGRNHGKKSPLTPPGIDPGNVRQVAQRLNHYAIPSPLLRILLIIFVLLCIYESSLCAHFSVAVQLYSLRIPRTSYNRRFKMALFFSSQVSIIHLIRIKIVTNILIKLHINST